MDKWVMLSQKDCSACAQAMALFALNGINPTIYWVNESPIMKSFLRDQGLTTVPQIYKNGMRIGGASDLVKYFGQ